MTTQEVTKFVPPRNKFIERYDPEDIEGFSENVLKIRETSSKNLIDEGLVSPVRDQSLCSGGCTAFSFAAVIESFHIMHSGDHLEIGAGWIHRCLAGMDCANGVDPKIIFEKLAGEMLPRADQGSLPWASNNCEINREIRVPELTPYYGDSQIMYALMNGSAVAAGMDFNWDFLDWNEDRYYETDYAQETFQHMVTIVGFDNLLGYWTLKNSFGPQWGQEGFFYASYGTCGIGLYPAYGVIH